MAHVEIPWGKPAPKEPRPEEKPATIPLKEWTPRPIVEPTKPPEVEIKETTHKCPKCGSEVADERIVLLGIPECAKCTPQGSRPMGVPYYGEKAGGTLMIITDPKIFKMMRKPVNQQR